MAALATFVRSRKASRYKTDRTGTTRRSIFLNSLGSDTPSGGEVGEACSTSVYPAAGCARSGSYLV